LDKPTNALSWGRRPAAFTVYKVQRTPERELLPMAEGFELAVMGWSPMAAGILTGK
jgi:aryl-alcohol dehydrogenase-like predicted oxidoreductase